MEANGKINRVLNKTDRIRELPAEDTCRWSESGFSLYCCRSKSTEGIRELAMNRDEHVLYICSKSLAIVHKFIAVVEQQLGEDLGAAKAAVVWRTHGALRMMNGAPPPALSMPMSGDARAR